MAAALLIVFSFLAHAPSSIGLAMQRERERAFGGGTVFPPETLSVLVDRSVLVIRGRVVGGSRTITRTDSRSNVAGYTYWEVQVLEVLKTDGAVTIGGRVNVGRGEQAVRKCKNCEWSVPVNPVPMLYAGEELVLFLIKDWFPRSYALTRGQAGLFEVDGSTVRLPPAGWRPQELRDRDSLSIAELRALLRVAK